MRVRELLEKKKKELDLYSEHTFIIERLIPGDSIVPRTVYETTQCETIFDWLFSGKYDDYVVIEQDHHPLESHHFYWYYTGELSCCLITPEQDWIDAYGEEDGRVMLEERTKPISTDGLPKIPPSFWGIYGHRG